jgi:hypothetical protein
LAFYYTIRTDDLDQGRGPHQLVFEICGVPISEDEAIAVARTTEALPGFDSWLANCPDPHQESTVASTVYRLQSFFRGPAQALDEEMRRRGHNIEVEDESRYLIRVSCNGRRAVTSFSGNTLAERTSEASVIVAADRLMAQLHA